MGWIRSAVERRSASPFVQAFLRGDDLPNTWGPNGMVVADEAGALRVIGIYACVRILSESIATLPLHTYKRRPGGGKDRATDHHLYYRLHDEPNPEMSSVDFWQALVGHVCLWGNSYAEIQRDRGDRPLALWPLRPDRMTIVRDTDNRLAYCYRMPDGFEVPFPARNILHVRGLSGNGIVGYSPIQLAAQAVGLALSAETYGAKFFANDSRPGGVLKHPGTLSDDAQKRLKAGWEEIHRGVGNSHRVAVLEEGVEWQQIGLPPGDVAWVEARQFQLQEIARLFRVPPHMLGDHERGASYAATEQQSLDFVVHTLRPWLVRLEKAIQRSLFTEGERRTHFAEFLVDGLLRGDIKSRYAAYAIGRQWGWLSADDVREYENQNPIGGIAGEAYWAPLNMVPADKLGEKPAPVDAGALPDPMKDEKDDEAKG